MTQVRCIKAINDYEVNDIVDVPDDGLFLPFEARLED